MRGGHILSERGVKNRVGGLGVKGGRLGEAEKEKASRIKRQGERKEDKSNRERRGERHMRRVKKNRVYLTLFFSNFSKKN